MKREFSVSSFQFSVSSFQFSVVLTAIILIILSNSLVFSSDLTDKSGTAGEVNNTDYSSFGDSVRMIASLLFVLALIIGAVFFLKKVPLYKRFMLGSKNPISVVTSVSLGHKRSVCVVKVANEMLILGLTNTNISLLSKMNADEFLSFESSDLSDSQNLTGENKISFLDQLKRAIGRKN
jgi:flagellar biosynthetic protein FliO